MSRSKARESKEGEGRLVQTWFSSSCTLSRQLDLKHANQFLSTLVFSSVK